MTEDVYGLLKRITAKAKGPFIFPSKTGPLRPIGSVRKAHDLAVERAGISDHFRPYDAGIRSRRAVVGRVDLPTFQLC